MAKEKADIERTVATPPPPALSLRGLTVSYQAPDRRLELITGVSLDIKPGEIVGLVGESGSGKTLTGRAVLGLLRRSPRMRVGGSVTFGGRELTTLPEGKLRRIRGGQIGMIFQDPVAALDPVIRVGDQIAEAIVAHGAAAGGRAVRDRMVELLSQVGITDPELRARQFPHEISGGMCQRVLIAIALAGNPALLIADEPTTALDVTIQAEILDLIYDLQAESQMAVLFVTHDWGVVADIFTKAVVMYAGQVVETAAVEDLLKSPQHPYTAALLAANPHLVKPEERLHAIEGSVASPGSWPTGCRFAPSCPLATVECTQSPIDM